MIVIVVVIGAMTPHTVGKEACGNKRKCRKQPCNLGSYKITSFHEPTHSRLTRSAPICTTLLLLPNPEFRLHQPRLTHTHLLPPPRRSVARPRK